jgi:hypothetical protein
MGKGSPATTSASWRGPTEDLTERGMGKTPVPAILRQQVNRWAETWFIAKFSRLLELRGARSRSLQLPDRVVLGIARQGLLPQHSVPHSETHA